MTTKSKIDPRIAGMSVSVTVVFACEAHREAWLQRMGVIPKDPSKMSSLDEPLTDEQHARWIDYTKRRRNTDLMYLADTVEDEHLNPL